MMLKAIPIDRMETYGGDALGLHATGGGAQGNTVSPLFKAKSENTHFSSLNQITSL